MTVKELIKLLEDMDEDDEVSISIDPQNEDVTDRIYADEIMEVMDSYGTAVILCNETSRNF